MEVMAEMQATGVTEATLALEARAATGAMEATAEMAEKEAQEAPVETAVTEETAATAATAAIQEMAETQVQEAQVAMEVTEVTGAMVAMGAILRTGHLERAATGRSRLEPPVKPRIISPLLQQRLQSLGSLHPFPQVVTLRQVKQLQS